MGRLFGLLGILSIVGSIVFMLGTAFMADNPLFVEPLEAIACTENETLRVERNSWSLPNGERGINITYFCDIEPNQGRSVTDMAVVLQIVVFVGLLMLGIILIGFGLSRSIPSKARAWRNQMQTSQEFGTRDGVSWVNVQGDLDNISPETRQLLENMMDGLVQNAAVSSKSAQSSSLVERLQQLEEAYQKNLISKAEYDTVRQAILDKMDD